MLTHIDLFSGIGGFALAAQWAGFRTVAFCEIDPYAQEILKQNFGAMAHAEAERLERRPDGREGIEEKAMRLLFARSDQSILHGDIRTFNGTAYRGATLLTGGFPCQPFSQAGKRRGKEDDRYLWPEMLRVISEARPAWVLGENVTGIITMELDRVLSDLEGEGYAVQALIIPACAVDAKHRRDRVWILAHANRGGNTEGRAEDSAFKGASQFERTGQEPVADAARFQQGRKEQRAERQRVRTCGESISDANSESSGWFAEPWKKHCEWIAESDVGRVAHGISNRVDRLKGLGNAIVPQVAYEIMAGIRDLYNYKYTGQCITVIKNHRTATFTNSSNNLSNTTSPSTPQYTGQCIAITPATTWAGPWPTRLLDFEPLCRLDLRRVYKSLWY